jgi:small multidrug resistance pump
MTYVVQTCLYLLFAILLEVAGITSMKLSDGFKHLEPSIMIFVFYTLSFFFLSLSLRRLEVGLAYAIWSGLGTVLIAFIGAVFFNEPITVIKALCLGFIVVGVFGLKIR